MSVIDRISDDYFKLFVRREGKVVLGRGCSTLWLLTAVLTATLLAIAFSNASMKYLSEKMNDPFIRWMDIPNMQDGLFGELESALGDEYNMERFDYGSVQADRYQAYMFFGAPGCDIRYLRVRFFSDLETDLMTAILSDDNVVDKACVESFEDPTVGLIVTEDALKILGYKEFPPYIDIQEISRGADTLGFALTHDDMARCPLPVLGVVKRLPSGVDMVASHYLFEQENNDDTYPFNMNNPAYAQTLNYFVPAEVDMDTFTAALRDAGERISSVPVETDGFSFWRPEIKPFRQGDYITLKGQSEAMLPLEASAINEELMKKWESRGVCRVYDFNFSPYDEENNKITNDKSYLSVYFNSLGRIRDFESWVNDEYKIKVDMSQVNSKENFNAVSIMAGILSWAIIVFAIICIILFIVNLLQSYFQKVKRNIGTFKAFGVSNRRLTSVYVLIVGVIILAAVLLALAIVFCAQELLIVCGFLKDGAYSYLSLWSGKTVAAVLIIIVASVATVFLVMKRLLRQTPGDLIYDRQ